MTKRQEQWAFLRDVSRLIEYIYLIDMSAIGGELQRFATEQNNRYNAGLSLAKAGESQHQNCKAIDIDFFDKSGKWLRTPDQDDKEGINIHRDKLKKIGDYWISLNPKNRWGGYFKKLYDPNHFERK